MLTNDSKNLCIFLGCVSLTTANDIMPCMWVLATLLAFPYLVLRIDLAHSYPSSEGNDINVC